MAIKALAWMVKMFDPPVYCYHHIVHNRAVVESFQRVGVVFVDDVSSVSPGAALMLSAHGSAPDVVAAAQQDGRTVVDAVCPLVTKVHHELKVRAQRGYDVVYVGHEGHDEVVGTMAVAPDAVHLVREAADVDALETGDRPVALLAQTTLSMDDWADVREAMTRRFDTVWTPKQNDLCFATTNRQAAVKALADRVDAMVIIGSPTSSNTDALERVAQESGCPRVERIDTAADLPSDLSGFVGVAAGASVPEQLVQDVVAALAPEAGTATVGITREDEYFPLPLGIRSRLPKDDLRGDRQRTASDALLALDRRSVVPDGRGGTDGALA